MLTLVFPPFFTTVGTFVEGSHRFIGRSNLQLVEVSLIGTTRIHWTLCSSLIHIIPETFTTQNVIDFFTGEDLSVKHLETVDLELIWTCRAVEPITTVIPRANKQHVGACGAERQHGGNGVGLCKAMRFSCALKSEYFNSVKSSCWKYDLLLMTIENNTTSDATSKTDTIASPITKQQSPFNLRVFRSPLKRGIIKTEPSYDSRLTLSPVKTPTGRAGLLSPPKRSQSEIDRSVRKRAKESTILQRLLNEDSGSDYLRDQDNYIANSILKDRDQAYGSDVELEEDISDVIISKTKRGRKRVIKRMAELSSEEEHDDTDDYKEEPNIESDHESEVSDIEEDLDDDDFKSSPTKKSKRSVPTKLKSPSKRQKKTKDESSPNPERRRVGRPSKSEDVVGKVKSIFHQDDEEFFMENKTPNPLPEKKPIKSDPVSHSAPKIEEKSMFEKYPTISGVESIKNEPEEVPTTFEPLPIPKVDKDGNIIDKEFLEKYFNGANLENNMRGRFLDEKAFFLEGSEGYFEQHSARPRPSSNSLTQLAPQIAPEDFAEYVSIGNKISLHEKESLRKAHCYLHHQFCFELSQGFSLNFYGVGSKLEFLNDFLENYFVNWYSEVYPQHQLPTIMVVNGYNPSIKFKSVLQDIMRSFMTYAHESREYEDSDSEAEGKPNKIRFPKHVSESVPFIMNYVESKRTTSDFVVPQLVLLIHNIDGEAFRDEKKQNAFAQLSSLPELWLISSTDNINAPLLWDLFKLKNFNFLWHDLTTYESYQVELSFKDVQNMGKSKKFIGNKGAKYVLTSLTSNARKLYKILLEKQLLMMKEVSNSKATRNSLKGSIKHGLEFKDFYNHCLEEFITSNEITFRTVLGEFVEHKMCALTKNDAGVEIVYIPFNYDEMEKILQDGYAQE